MLTPVPDAIYLIELCSGECRRWRYRGPDARYVSTDLARVPGPVELPRSYGYCFLMKRLSPRDSLVLNLVGLPPLISAPSNW